MNRNAALLRLLSFLVLVLLVFGRSMAAAETPPAKEQNVRELLVVMRAGDTGMQVVDAMIATLKEALPSAPAEYWTSLRQNIKAGDFVEMLVPVYAKHLDAADINELIRFYRTPTGQRFLDRQPAILQDSLVIGQKWGEQIAQRALADLKKK
ncbi:MAG TPA: DUF2059 domain-containing protein [Thermoanaerobaculia bacterium]|nr:DUF2059 domain-containing protein [Thermoanaerobaculia bacterium]